MRRARAYLVVLLLALVAAWLLALVHPLLALVPLIVPGAPAVLLAWATIRHGDPYSVLHKYGEPPV